MKNIQYFDIVKRALMITWKNKFLWFFGFFIFIGSFSTSLNFNSDRTATKKDIAWETISNYIQKYPKLFIGLVVTLVVLMIVLFIFRIIVTAAIIKSVNNIAVYRQSKISAIFSESKKYFWRLALLEIIICLSLIVFITILIIPVAYLWILEAKISAIFSGIIAAVIFLVLAVIALYLRKYAYFYMVLGDMKMKMALEAAYILLRKNIWESLIMSCIGIALNVIAMMFTFVLLLSLALVFSPFGFVAYIMFAKTGALIILITGIIIGGIVFLLSLSFFTAFTQSAWVLFFQEISLEKKEENKVFEKIAATEKIPDPEII